MDFEKNNLLFSLIGFMNKDENFKIYSSHAYTLV